MTVGMALDAIKLVMGLKGNDLMKAAAGAAKGDPKSIAELGKVLGEKFGDDLDPSDISTIAQAAVAERDGGSAFDLPGVSLDTINEIGMGKPMDYAIDGALNLATALARGYADQRRLDADALASVLLRKAARRAESPFSQGLLEDKYRAQAAKYSRDKLNGAQYIDKIADAANATYGRYRSDKDYTRGQKMAHINPMSGNRSLAEVRQQEIARRISDMNK